MKFIFKTRILSKDNLKSLSMTGKRPHYFLPEEYKAWEEQIGWSALRQMSEAGIRKCYFNGMLAGKLDFYWTDRRLRDVPNYQKSFLDALKGIVYPDDSRIFLLILNKYLGCTDEKIEFEIEQIPRVLSFSLNEFLLAFSDRKLDKSC